MGIRVVPIRWWLLEEVRRWWPKHVPWTPVPPLLWWSSLPPARTSPSLPHPSNPLQNPTISDSRTRYHLYQLGSKPSLSNPSLTEEFFNSPSVVQFRLSNPSPFDLLIPWFSLATCNEIEEQLPSQKLSQISPTDI
jgi:hypothetical protein